MGIAISPLKVRRSILIKASPARVWEAFTSSAALSQWFGVGHQLHHYEPGEDGQIDLSIEADGARRHFGGPTICWEPARELSFEINWQAPHSWPVPTFFTILLTQLYDSTGVEFFHHGFDQFGQGAADMLQGYEEGWDTRHLEALRKIVE